MKSKIINIIPVVQNKIFRQAIKFYLENLLSYSIINEASDFKDLLLKNNIGNADVIILEINDNNYEMETASQILLKIHDTKIIALSSYKDKIYLNEMKKKGFDATVFKNSIYDDLDSVIKKVVKNSKTYFTEAQF